MRVLKARSALLSDFEVLKALREMETEQRVRVNGTAQVSELEDESKPQSAAAVKGEEDDVWLSNVPENLRTIQYEVSCCHSKETRIELIISELR